MIDAALAMGPRQFNWSDKIYIRLTIDELPQVAAAFFGIIPKVKLANDGTGIVSYNDKQYRTKPLGLTSLTAGTEVELSFAKGVYYSKF